MNKRDTVEVWDYITVLEFKIKNLWNLPYELFCLDGHIIAYFHVPFYLTYHNFS